MTLHAVMINLQYQTDLTNILQTASHQSSAEKCVCNFPLKLVIALRYKIKFCVFSVLSSYFQLCGEAVLCDTMRLSLELPGLMIAGGQSSHAAAGHLSQVKQAAASLNITSVQVSNVKLPS